jgi:hypothetical protein
MVISGRAYRTVQIYEGLLRESTVGYLLSVTHISLHSNLISTPGVRKTTKTGTQVRKGKEVERSVGDEDQYQ